MPKARTVLKRELDINPRLARTNFFYAKVLRNDGDYGRRSRPSTHRACAILPRPRGAQRSG